MTNQAIQTTTIYGKKYKEGDTVTNDLQHFAGCTLVLSHIPDELADKEEPVQEPEILTLEEARESDGVYLIHPVAKTVDWLDRNTVYGYYTLAAHIAAGRKTYLTKKDAQLARNLGWS